MRARGQSPSHRESSGGGEVEVAAACARLLTLLVAPVAGHFPAGRQAAQITADRRPAHRNNGAGEL